MKRSAKPPEEIELRPDGWERFERAVDAAVVSGPRPRMAKSARLVDVITDADVFQRAFIAFATGGKPEPRQRSNRIRRAPSPSNR